MRALLNGSYLRFATVQPLQHFLQQPKIGHDIGFDFSLGLLYRPLLNNNIVLTGGGVAAFIPGNGFRDALTSETSFKVFSMYASYTSTDMLRQAECMARSHTGLLHLVLCLGFMAVLIVVSGCAPSQKTSETSPHSPETS